MGRAYTILKYIAIFFVFDQLVWPSVIHFVRHTFFSEPELPLNCKGYDCANGRPGPADKTPDDVATCDCVATTHESGLVTYAGKECFGGGDENTGLYTNIMRDFEKREADKRRHRDEQRRLGLLCKPGHNLSIGHEDCNITFRVDVPANTTVLLSEMLNDNKQLRRDNAFLKRRVARLERAFKKILDRQTF